MGSFLKSQWNVWPRYVLAGAQSIKPLVVVFVVAVMMLMMTHGENGETKLVCRPL